ncbi:unnamed protein product [Cochlearia groenlandica]
MRSPETEKERWISEETKSFKLRKACDGEQGNYGGEASHRRRWLAASEKIRRRDDSSEREGGGLAATTRRGVAWRY